MEINDVILGFLEWKPMTGYELKSLFEDLDFLPWSGNNNQIYKGLLQLEKDGLVTKIVIQQENLPAQKRYSVTKTGREQLQFAVMQPPEDQNLAIRNGFLLQLAWSECLTTAEIRQLVMMCQNIVESELKLNQEVLKRKMVLARRSAREEFIWNMIFRNRIVHLQSELNWLQLLYSGLADFEPKRRGTLV